MFYLYVYYIHDVHAWWLRKKDSSVLITLPPPLGTWDVFLRNVQIVDVLLSLEPVTERSTCFSSQGDTVKVVSACFFPVEDRHVCTSIAMLLTHLLSTCCLLGTACCAIVQEGWGKWGGVPLRTQLVSGHHSYASHIFTSCRWNGLWKATSSLVRATLEFTSEFDIYRICEEDGRNHCVRVLSRLETVKPCPI